MNYDLLQRIIEILIFWKTIDTGKISILLFQ